MPDPIGKNLVWDVETDGLHRTVTKLHCIVAIDDETGEEYAYHDRPDFKPRSGSIKQGLAVIAKARQLIGHNIVDYDLRVLPKLSPGWECGAIIGEDSVADTLVYSRLFRPDLFDADRALVKRGKLEPQLMKSHSLKAWGQRLGEHKGDPGGDWSTFTQKMLDYALQDVRTNRVLWHFLRGKRLDQRALFHEHRIADTCARQEHNGFGFDQEAALELQTELLNELHRVTLRLRKVFPPWFMARKASVTKATRRVKLTDFPNVTMARYSEKTGKRLRDYVGPPIATYTEGTHFTPIRLTEFSPTSRDHVANRLMHVYKWKPSKFTPDGKVQMDEAILESLPTRLVPTEVKEDLIRVFALTKILGMLGQGAQSWLRNYNPDTRAIHGRVNPNGAVTGRGTHQKPNMAQVPKVLKNAKGEILRGFDGGWGYEARSLFVPTRRHLGWEMTGTDQSSLELRTMAHYLSPFDGGDYIKRLSEPGFDPHSYHLSLLAGLLETRDQSKTGVYAFLYGAGLWLLGHHVDPSASDAKKIRLGKEFRHLLLSNFPGLEDLYNLVQTRLKNNGFLIGLDGRRIYCRAQHSAFNFLLQSAGAVVCKRWIIEVEDGLRRAGLVEGEDFAQMAWVHDEIQIEHRPELGDIIGKEAVAAAVRSGPLVGLRCPTTGECKTGNSWAETH